MAPALLLPLLELAGKFIPVIAEKFSSGSEVAQRNVAAGKALGEAIVEATQAVNLQEAVTKLESDPEARAAANAVVADLWPSLFETGGGGVTEARKMVFSPDQLPPWRNAAVWITAAFVPLIYAAAYAVLYREGASDDLKTMVVTAIFAGLLGSITGFFLGSSLGSQKKDQAMGRQA